MANLPQGLKPEPLFFPVWTARLKPCPSRTFSWRAFCYLLQSDLNGTAEAVPFPNFFVESFLLTYFPIHFMEAFR